MDEGTSSGAGGGGDGSPLPSGRQAGVVQSLSWMTGFLDRVRDAVRKARASLCPALGCFSEVELGSESEGRKETKSPWTGAHRPRMRLELRMRAHWREEGPRPLPSGLL